MENLMELQAARFNPRIRLQDRRKETVPIEYEKRTGIDRRKQSVFNKLQNDIDKFDLTEKFLYVTSPLCPTTRRICSAPQSIKDKDYSRAGILGGLALANLPRDFEEMKYAVREGKNIFRNMKEASKQGKNIFKSGLKAIEYQGQHQSSFFKGTFLEFIPEKINWLKKTDKTLYNTKFGELTRKIFNIKIDSNNLNKIEASSIGKIKFLGTQFQKISGRALYRVPVIGLIMATAIEIPALVKSVTKTEGTISDKSKAFTKQLIKSAGYIGIVNASIAIAGAALIPFGYIASLAGMGIGSIIGLEASKLFNKSVDKII